MPRITKATGSPVLEAGSMSRLFATTASPSSLQPVRPIIPACVKTRAAGLSSGSMRRTACVCRIPGDRATRGRAHLLILRPGPFLVEQVVGVDPLPRLRGAAGDALDLVQEPWGPTLDGGQKVGSLHETG